MLVSMQFAKSKSISKIIFLEIAYGKQKDKLMSNIIVSYILLQKEKIWATRITEDIAIFASVFM